MYNKFIIAFLLLLIHTKVFSKEISIALKDDVHNSFKIAYSLYILTDSNATIQFQEAQASNQFKLHQKSIAPNLGFTSANYWFKFIITNTQTKQHRVLEFAYPFFNQLDVYIPNMSGQYKKIAVGDHLPFEARPIIHKNFLFDLNFEMCHSFFFNFLIIFIKISPKYYLSRSFFNRIKRL